MSNDLSRLAWLRLPHYFSWRVRYFYWRPVGGDFVEEELNKRGIKVRKKSGILRGDSKYRSFIITGRKRDMVDIEESLKVAAQKMIEKDEGYKNFLREWLYK